MCWFIFIVIHGFKITQETPPLGIPKRTFPEGFKGERKGYSECGWYQSIHHWYWLSKNEQTWLALFFLLFSDARSPTCMLQLPHTLHTFPAMADGTLLTMSQKNYFFSNVAFCQLFDCRDKKVTSNSISVEVILFLLCSPHPYGKS